MLEHPILLALVIGVVLIIFALICFMLGYVRGYADRKEYEHFVRRLQQEKSKKTTTQSTMGPITVVVQEK